MFKQSVGASVSTPVSYEVCPLCSVFPAATAPVLLRLDKLVKVSWVTFVRVCSGQINQSRQWNYVGT